MKVLDIENVTDPLMQALGDEKSFNQFLERLGLRTEREDPPYPFRNFVQGVPDPDSGLFLPAFAGGAEEAENTIGTISVSWATVAAVPGLQRLQIASKTLLRRLILRQAGLYDQSVGAETQATEGNPVLIQEARLNADGRIIRRWPGSVLYEMNKFVVGGGGPKTDPSVGVATLKAFSTTLIMEMGFLDIAERATREDTYLDLSQYANVFLEVQYGAFNRYVSGNTQANMSATLTVSSLEVIGPRRLPQRHFEMLQVSTEDMSTTQSDRPVPLIRNKTILRGILLRVGTLNATPIITAVTALTNLGISGKLVAGATVFPKLKQPTAYYQSVGGFERNNVTLTAGYVWIDFASNRSWKSLQAGAAYSDLNLLYDKTGVALTLMEVYQASVIR